MYISFCQFEGEHAPSVKVGKEIRKILPMFNIQEFKQTSDYPLSDVTRDW
jgi:hypothetical protein